MICDVYRMHIMNNTHTHTHTQVEVDVPQPELYKHKK